MSFSELIKSIKNSRQQKNNTDESSSCYPRSLTGSKDKTPLFLQRKSASGAYMSLNQVRRRFLIGTRIVVENVKVNSISMRRRIFMIVDKQWIDFRRNLINFTG